MPQILNDPNHRYLSMEADRQLREHFELRMLEENHVPGLLPLTVCDDNGVLTLNYDISGKDTLASLAMNQKLLAPDIRRLILTLKHVISEAKLSAGKGMPCLEIEQVTGRKQRKREEKEPKIQLHGFQVEKAEDQEKNQEKHLAVNSRNQHGLPHCLTAVLTGAQICHLRFFNSPGMCANSTAIRIGVVGTAALHDVDGA